MLFKECPKKVEPLLLVGKYAHVMACVGICLCSAVYISLLDKLIAQAAGNQMFLRILRSKQRQVSFSNQCCSNLALGMKPICKAERRVTAEKMDMKPQVL